jgi:multicomponent Na+:H+ antiporter subunit D
MKITLFFCAGNLAETLGIHNISDMNGIGRRMPWTMAAFTVAALGMIGVPPLAGFISKWYLGLGALDVGQDWVIIVLAGSSLLNAGYFLPVLYAAWFKMPPDAWPAECPRGRRETTWALLAPPVVTALLTLAAGLLAAAPFSPLQWARFITTQEYAP